MIFALNESYVVSMENRRSRTKRISQSSTHHCSKNFSRSNVCSSRFPHFVRGASSIEKNSNDAYVRRRSFFRRRSWPSARNHRRIAKRIGRIEEIRLPKILAGLGWRELLLAKHHFHDFTRGPIFSRISRRDPRPLGSNYFPVIVSARLVYVCR